MKARAAIAFVALLVLLLADSGRAYFSQGRRWPANNTIVMHLELGSPTTPLIDGSRDWDSVAESALAAWNPYLNGASFSARRDSSAIASGNGINTASFADDVFGEPFGSGVLAVTQTFYSPSNNTITEADVVFNKARTWNSYRGNQRSGIIDLRRVALHEFGHVLGLDHPDDHGQSVTAVMNSHVSNVDSLQTDDINGAIALYGGTAAPNPSPTPTPSPSPAPAPRSNRPPTVAATCSPCTVEIATPSQLAASASDPDGDALTYQWTVAQGSLSSVGSNRPVWTAPLAPSAVVATVTVTDNRGGFASASVTLQVVLRDTLPSGARLIAGQTLISNDGRYMLAYQGDGNLVLYDQVLHTVEWSSGTAGRTAGVVGMQGDGNLVIYDALTRPLWMSGTATSTNARMVLQADGNIVVYAADGQAVWDRFSNPAGFVP